MKNTKSNNLKPGKIAELHTNRLLVSTSVALASLVALLLIHRGQSYSHTIIPTQAIVMVLCVLSAASAVVLGFIAITRKKMYLMEYAVIALIMAFCLFCLHGVGFVTIKLMKYITAAILVAYLIIAFAYHTIVPRITK